MHPNLQKSNTPRPDFLPAGQALARRRRKGVSRAGGVVRLSPPVSNIAPRTAIERPRRHASSSGAISFVGDAALVSGLRAGQPAAVRVFYDRYAPLVRRLLGRVLGAERELADLHHDVFVRALGSLKDLRDPDALKAWISAITVFTARSAIQRRSRRRWLSFFAPEDLPEPETPAVSGEVSEALRSTYATLDKLPADERIAFALRFIDGMELTEVADACGVSLATIKRRLARAEDRFTSIAREHPVLKEWVERGSRWGS
jgi:RNA polymerase sigma-70 factor, ECF subfamily